MIRIVTPIRKRAQPEDPSGWNPSEEDFEYLGERTPEGEFIPAQPSDFMDDSAPELADEYEDPAETELPPVQRTYTPYVPKPREITPISPEEVLMGQEIPMPMGEIERMNAELSVRQKIVHGLLNGIPLRIRYITLDGMSQTERTVHPDYVYWAGTGRHILVAMDEMSGDWRAFAVSNIEMANLEPEE